MRKIITTIILLAVGLTVRGQWINLTSPTSLNLFSVQFTGMDTGYVVGGDINSSIFLKTTDGGANWSTLTNTQTKWLYDVLFLNDTVGIACGYNGAIYKTTNAGASWSSKPSQTTAWLYAVAARPDGVLYAVGTDGAMVKSVNMGDNWNPVVSNTAQTMLDIQFYDNQYGSAVGYNGEMIHTTDGGNNWAVKLMGTNGSMTGVWMLSPDTIWVCGYTGRLYKTTNAGQSFVLNTLGTNDINGIYFLNDQVGYLCGYQEIYETSNGGATWNQMSPLPTPNTLRDIYVLPDNVTMYCVGGSGTILKNINSIGIEESSSKELSFFPNPCINGFTLWVGGSGEVSIYDCRGMFIKQQSFTDVSGGLWISTEGMASGAYILRVKQGGSLLSSRFVVSR